MVFWGSTPILRKQMFSLKICHFGKKYAWTHFTGATKHFEKQKMGKHLLFRAFYTVLTKAPGKVQAVCSLFCYCSPRLEQTIRVKPEVWCIYVLSCTRFHLLSPYWWRRLLNMITSHHRVPLCSQSTSLAACRNLYLSSKWLDFDILTTIFVSRISYTNHLLYKDRQHPFR